MKTVFTILLILISSFSYPSSNTLHYGKRIQSYKTPLSEYKIVYNEIIEYIKVTEGFRSTVYCDRGYPCVGYGQRLKFYKYTITEPITESQAEEILNISFKSHIRMVKRLLPQLNDNKLLSVSLQSYKIGIGRLLNKHIVIGTELNIPVLKSIGDSKSRQYEIDIFYR